MACATFHPLPMFTLLPLILANCLACSPDAPERPPRTYLDASTERTYADTATNTDAPPDAIPETTPTGSCENAFPIDLPPIGDMQIIKVSLSEARAELKGSCGGLGLEQVLSFEPDEDMALLITAGGENSFNPVLHMRKDNCWSETNEIDCQSGPPGVQLLLSLEAMRSYFLIIDSDNASVSETTVVTIARLN